MAIKKDEDTGLSRRPQGVCVCTGGPLMREAQCQLHATLTRKQKHAGGQLKHNREAHQGGGPQQ